MGKYKKITDGEHLSSNELTAEEKKHLYASMEAYGMAMSTAHRRFFDKGFSKWEILGVSQLRDIFLNSAPVGDDNDNIGYAYVKTLEPDYDDSHFYNLLTELKLGARFCDFMADFGMSSQMTVRTRFKENDWKPWELKGIKSILEECHLE